MKRIKFLFFLVIIFLSSLNSNAQLLVNNKKLLKEVDSVSYAIGMSTAMRMQIDPMAEGLNSDLFIQGYLNVIKSKKDLLLQENEVENILKKYFQKKQKEILTKNKLEKIKEKETKYASYKKENESFLKNNKLKKGVVTTKSGLQYEIIKKGKGESPKTTDRVKVHYHGVGIDGVVFDSSVEKKRPFEFSVTHVIEGWTEGLQLMNVGAKFKFFIPQELAYGYEGMLPKIKPFSTLIFEIELLEIK